ncbi:helix-turn-helix domain-containing protein [Candidatus Avelusimicrobium fimicolum]|uniref:helix-turn-helix domain-containing protein n=1 Tax=Candidatus Avelusimicrobium fimicolum TaxID=3416216 RepID=UPI003D0E26F8
MSKTKLDIKAIRKIFGITQDELAQRLGVKQSTVSMWEGDKRAPSGTAQRMLAQVCKDLINERFGSK